MLRALIFEAIGTAILVFATCMAERMNYYKRINEEEPFAKALVDFFVFASLYFIGHRISGCHLNPAVSFAMAFTPKFSILEVMLLGGSLRHRSNRLSDMCGCFISDLQGLSVTRPVVYASRCIPRFLNQR